VSDLKVSEAHLQELRKVHSMLHASMDALIRDMNANEAARLLILLDDRLTSLINSAAAEREPKPDRKRPDRPFTGVVPTMSEALPAEAPPEHAPAMAADAVAKPMATESASGKDATAKVAVPATGSPAEAKHGAPAAASAVSPPPLPETPASSKPPVFEPPAPKPFAPKATAVPPPAPTPEAKPKAAEHSEAETLSDSGPILFVPPPPPPKPSLADRLAAVATPAQPATVVKEDAEPLQPAISAAGKPEALPPEPPAVPKAAPASALSDAPKQPSAAPVAPLPEVARPLPAVPPVAPLTIPAETIAEQDEGSEPDWIEEDLEDGEDLKERVEADTPSDPFEDETADVAATPAAAAPAVPSSAGGLFGSGLFSKLKLPGFGRRKAEEKEAERASAEGEADDLLDDLDDAFEEDLDEDLIEAEDDLAPSEADHDRDIRRLHAVVDQLAADNLLDEALRRTGNRIELRKVEDGLDIVVKGLPAALGTVRLDAKGGHVLYQPRFGLDLPEREPNRADLELWLKAMGDVVVHVLADIAQRRSKAGASDSEPTD